MLSTSTWLILARFLTLLTRQALIVQVSRFGVPESAELPQLDFGRCTDRVKYEKASCLSFASCSLTPNIQWRDPGHSDGPRYLHVAHQTRQR